MLEKYSVLREAIIDGEDAVAVQELHGLIDNGDTVQSVISNCVEPTLNELGEQFSTLKIFLPDLMIAAEVVDALQEEFLKYVPVGGQNSGAVRGIIGTVAGDMHDIGKNMVKMMLSVNGFEMYDMGVDVPSKSFIAKIDEVNAKLVCLSGLMMPSLPFMKETVELIKHNPKYADVKVIVGGGPVTEAFAMKIGADGYSDDAFEAVKLAKTLMRVEA
ncbi:MAG: cobalamin-dependent protein [Bacillota bacterium]